MCVSACVCLSGVWFINHDRLTIHILEASIGTFGHSFYGFNTHPLYYVCLRLAAHCLFGRKATCFPFPQWWISSVCSLIDKIHCDKHSCVCEYHAIYFWFLSTPNIKGVVILRVNLQVMHTCTHLHAHELTHMHLHTHVLTHTCTYTHMYLHTHALTHTHPLTYTHTYINTDALTHTPT